MFDSGGDEGREDRRPGPGGSGQPTPGGDRACVALVAAVDALLARPSASLPGLLALERLRTVLVTTQRLAAVTADGVTDLGSRELFALDAAGSAGSWLRTQVGGDPGLIGLARRLDARPQVLAELRAGRISQRAAQQLCAALDRVPDTVDEAALQAVLTEGTRQLLDQAHGGSPDDLAQIVEVLTECAGSVSPPDVRLEPVVLLLAHRLAPAALPSALTALVDALTPDEPPTDEPVADPYHLDLAATTGGWHLSGFLDHETGLLLDAELDRRTSAGDADTSDEASAASERDRAGSAAAPGPDRLVTTGQRRACALRQLLHDSADGTAGTGHAPAEVVVYAALDTVLGVPGALPGQLLDGTLVGPRTVQRLGCGAALGAVLLDAAGHPVGAGGTHRHATRRERRCLRVQWGSRCAVTGCHRPGTVPHHVRPWWLSGRTRVEDLLPVCRSHHHDVHEGQRVLRVRDGRTITPTGWG